MLQAGGGYATMFVQKRRGGKTKATQGGSGILVALQGACHSLLPLTHGTVFCDLRSFQLCVLSDTREWSHKWSQLQLAVPGELRHEQKMNGVVYI